MPEHRIRLRAGWEILDADGSRRLDLPTDWPAGIASKLRLARKFGRPRHDPAVESLRIEILDVPGLVAIRLNGRWMEIPDGSTIDLDEPLPPRNELVLEVDLAARPHPGWGSVALVIAPRSTLPQ